jgi:hypothetical protein
MKWAITWIACLTFAAAAWGLSESGTAVSPGAAPVVKAGAARDVSAAPADATALKKARDEAVRKVQELARTRRTLSSARPKFEFESMPIKDVLKYMSDVGRFSVVFDQALEEAGIDLSTRTVSLRATGMTYESALNLILPKECGYRVEAGYVLITTLEKSWVPLKVGTYSIHLALAQVPDFTDAPKFAVSQFLQSASQAGGGGGGGSLFGPANAAQAETEKNTATPERIIEMIKKFVKNQTDRRIAPWDDEGGPASIQYTGGRLIISQTEQGHRAIARLLASIE